jgi:hypothetical protein
MPVEVDAEVGAWVTIAAAAAAEGTRKVIELLPVRNRRQERARRVSALSDASLLRLQEIYEDGDPRLPPEELVDWQLLLSTVEPSIVMDRIIGSWRHRTLLVIGERFDKTSGHYLPKGLLYFHTSWTKGLAFGSVLKTASVSAIDSDPGLSKPSPLTRLMFDKMQQYLRGPCFLWPIHRILFEIEDPKTATEPIYEKWARNRLLLFQCVARPEKYALYRVEWDYVQPFPDSKLLAQSPVGSELHMQLMIADVKDRECIRLSELKKIILFIYGTVYASIVNQRDPADQLYLSYLHHLAARECNRISALGQSKIKLTPVSYSRSQ